LTSMTKIKICGITNLTDATAAIEAGADMLGFNFYPKSPRFIDIGLCSDITSRLRSQYAHVVFVGVFVNMPPSEVYTTIETCGLALAQLHGDETPEDVAALNGRAFKAIRTTDETETQITEFIRFSVSKSVPTSVSQFHPLSTSVSQFHPLSTSVSQPALLVDAAVKGVYGGSGVVADWSVAEKLAKQIPLLLAGGLTPENAAEALRQVQPWGVDVASGVEASPGKKDFDKMKRFVEAVRKIQ
jgi:phosphoribosylanthranilate isomerase